MCLSITFIVFANGQEDRRPTLGRFITRTQRMVLEASLLNPQNYKVRIKSKVEQSRERRISQNRNQHNFAEKFTSYRILPVA